MLDLTLRLYYPAKRFLPRRLQLALRRSLVAHKLRKHTALWPINPATAAPPPGWTGWPEGKRFALVLTHDVESQRGLDRVLRVADLEESLGFRSSFNFVAGDYAVPSSLREELEQRGFEVGLHGLTHDGTLYHSKREFLEQATRINAILKDWKVAGFRSPCMYHNLEWLHDLDIEYDASTFDTDPFEPQPDALGTIFPLFIPNPGNGGGYVELPYTLPQDLHLFVLMRETSIDIWKKKLAWLAANGGLALVTTHPDYMAFGDRPDACDEYPVEHYAAFLAHISQTYQGGFWHALPRQLARYWKLQPQSGTGAAPLSRTAGNHLKPLSAQGQERGSGGHASAHHTSKGQPLKILMLTESHFPQDIRVRQEASTLVDLGHSVSVICLKNKGEDYAEEVNGVKVYRLPEVELFKQGKHNKPEEENNSRRLITLAKALLGYGFEFSYFTVGAFFASLFLHHKGGFDVIHTHNPPDTLFTIASFYRLFGKKFVYDQHDLCPDLFKEKYGSGLAPVYSLLLYLENRSCRAADFVIATNESYRAIEIERCKVKPDRIFIVRNGPNLIEMKPDEPIAALRSSAKTILCYLGAINIQDGVDYLLEVFRKIIFDHHYQDICLLVIGDGDFLFRIKELAEAMQVFERVVFTGYIDDRALLAKYLSTADIFVDAAPFSFLNDNSTFIKHMEYMAFGKPIVSFALKESMFSVGDAGIFVEPNDTDAMAEAIVALAEDENQRRSLGEKALKRVAELSWDKVSVPLVQAYRTLQSMIEK